MVIKKISGYWGGGTWGRKGSLAHAKQLKRRGFGGVTTKKVKSKGWTVYYTKKGKGSKYFKWKQDRKKLGL